jgi:hypothetical protein
VILPSAGFGPGRSLRLARARGSRAARDADLGHKAYDHSVARTPVAVSPPSFTSPTNRFPLAGQAIAPSTRRSAYRTAADSLSPMHR